jgi:hypothetical protein
MQSSCVKLYRNLIALLPMPPHHSTPKPSPAAEAIFTAKRPERSVLSWPAWRRVALVVPVLVLLWLAVAWASVDVVAL